MRFGWPVVWTFLVAAGLVFGGCGEVNICAVDSDCADDSCPADEEPFCDIPSGEVFGSCSCRMEGSGGSGGQGE
ncbi:MAG: hypothetical protein AAF997_10250 [Myxococcota bacterium]